MNVRSSETVGRVVFASFLVLVLFCFPSGALVPQQDALNVPVEYSRIAGPAWLMDRARAVSLSPERAPSNIRETFPGGPTPGGSSANNSAEQGQSGGASSTSGEELNKSNSKANPGWHFIKAPLVSHEHAKAYYKSSAAGKTKGAVHAQNTAAGLLTADSPSPEINELARALFNDPQQIYVYIHNNIDYVPYFGSLKGATLTYLDGSGNDFDQASLMIALLRASGYTAEYVYCQVTIPGAQVANWLGVDQNFDAISRVIAYGGIPGEVETDGTATLDRVWVKVNINGVDQYFDPAFKPYSYTSKINIGQAIGYDQNGFISEATAGATIGADYVQNLNEANIRNRLNAYSSNLIGLIRNHYANRDIKEIIGGREIVPNDTTQHSATLVEPWPEIPHEYTTTLQIQHAGIDYTIYTPDLGGKRLTLTYSAGDHHPELRLDGSLVASGAGTAAGSKLDLTITVDHPYSGLNGTYADQPATYKVESGRSYAIVYNLAGAGDALIQQRQKQLDSYRAQGLSNTSEAVLGETMNLMGITYLKEGYLANRLISALADTVITQHHAVGLIAQEEGYYIDVRNINLSLMSKHFTAADEQAHLRTAALIYSAFEHGMLEQLMGSDKPSVSTVKLFQLANSTRIKVFSVNSSNYATGPSPIRPQLVYYSLEDLDDFQSRVNDGFDLILPQNGQLVLNQWKGQGYVSKKVLPDWQQFEMGIGGGYSGGFGSFLEGIDVSWVYDNTFNNNYVYEQTPLTVAASASFEPIEMASGAYFFDHSDLELAGKPPLSLSFARSYDSRLNFTERTLGYGWTHNLDIYIKETSHGEPGLGSRQPVDAAALIAGLYVNLQLFNAQDNLQTWMIASLASKWAMDQLIDNAVTVNLGKKAIEFIKLPDQTYASPPGITTTLVRNTDGTYSVRERFGTQLDFNANKQISRGTDVDGNTMTFSYSGTNLTTVADAFGRSISLQYSGNSVNRVLDSTGRSILFGYDANNNLTAVTDPEGKIWGYGYDGSHRMTDLRNPLGITTAANTYDALGRVMTQTVPRQGGTNAVYSYYFDGYSGTEVDPSGHWTSFFYDSKGREYAKIDTLGNQVYKVFDGQDHVVEFYDQRWYLTSYEYDNQNNLVRITDPYGYMTTNTYDAQFRLTDVTDPLSHTTSYAYDTKHHPVSATDAVGNTTRASYYSNGLTNTRKDGRDVVTTLTYDGYGNLHTLQTGSHPQVTQDYDATGRLLALTDQVRSRTSFSYDRRGLLLSRTDPLGYSTILTYDNAGRVSTRKDRNGDVISYTYTPSGKVDTVTYPNSSSIIYTYDSLDNLVSMRDATGTTSYAYDELNRLKSITDPRGFMVSYKYDEAGNIIELKYPGNRKVTYTYNPWNRLETVRSWLGQTATYYYDAAGRCTGLTHFNGTQIYYNLDAANRLTDIDIVNSDLATWIAYYSFALDGNGNRTGELNSVPLDPPAPGASTAAYSYNEMKNRLISAAGSSFTYDNEGQLNNGSGSSYTFDYDHRLTGIGAAASFSYDGSGNRLQAVKGSAVTRYIHDARGNLLAEADASNQITRYYVYGMGLLAMITPENQTYCYHFDATGNTIAITDNTENVINGYAYDPYGKVVDEVETVQQPFKFVGQYGVMAEQNGFYYMRARYYDPGVGRFISEDPIGLAGGDVNLYGYVTNNPINLVDPSGLLAPPWHFGITSIAAMNSGKSLGESLILAWNATAVDFGSQGTSPADTVQHAMATAGQSTAEAIAATNAYIQASINSGNLPGAIHAAQDLATPGHAGQEWPGFKWDWNTAMHISGDAFPSLNTINQAYQNTKGVLNPCTK